jgi:hypothetical protein
VAAITFDRFEQGIDRRKGRSVADANRLYELRNCYVTTGWAIRKRPGLRLVSNLSGITKGLFGFDGKLYTFSGFDNPNHTASGVTIDNHRMVSGSLEISKLHFVDAFNGQLYAAPEYTNGSTTHFYNAVAVSDVNCPDSNAAVKLASKIFAIDGENVDYSATSDPTDWTTASDAGFLPTGLRSPGSPNALAVAEYDGQLVVFMVDSTQVWLADPDPANISLDRVIQNVGTRYPKSITPVSRDLFFTP